MSSPSQQPHDTSKCPCGACHRVRVAEGTQQAYEHSCRAATNRVLNALKGGGGEEDAEEDAEEDNKAPLCHRCNKTRAWRGECVNCYMAQHSQMVFVRGDWRLPNTDGIRQAYWMEEEAYAQMHRAQRERRAASKQSAVGGGTAAPTASNAVPDKETELNFIKDLFEKVQGVKYDATCPHGEPFYACMSCSH